MKIADNLELDLERLHGQRILLQGASGSGKSTGARVILEATYGAFQHIIIDVEDEFHTLRTAEREYAIIGGDHGDAPLTTKQDAGELAQTLLRIGVNVVLQIGDWTLQEKRVFIGDFIAGMMHAKSDLWHPVIVMLDETHNWAPQQGVVDSSEAVTHLATAGRKRGYGAIFASQRISLINKDVMGQCENKFLGRIEQSVDRRAVADLLGFSPRSQEAIDMQSFKAGEFYVAGPALATVPTRARLYKSATEAPKPGTTVLPSATPAAIRDALAALSEASQPEEAVERKNVVVSPGSKIVEFYVDGNRLWTEADLVEAKKVAYDAGYAQGSDDGLKQGYADGHKAALNEAGRRVLMFASDFAIFTGQPAEPPRSIHTFATPNVERAELGLPSLDQVITELRNSSPDLKGYTTPLDPTAKPSPSTRKLINAIIAAYPLGMTLEKAAKRAGISQKSSAYRKYLAEAASSSLLQPRPDGKFYAVERDDTVQAPRGLADFTAKLPPSYARMLGTIEVSKAPLTAEEIAVGAAVSYTSSGLKSGLRELLSLGLIEANDGLYTLSPDFR